MTLAQDIACRLNGCIWRARANYFFAYSLLATAVAASAASAVAVATETWPKEIRAVLAALPGLIVLTTGTFKFEGRADWWWSKYHGPDALHRALKYEKRSEDDISREMTSLIKGLEAKWPGFGKPPSK